MFYTYIIYMCIYIFIILYRNTEQNNAFIVSPLFYAILKRNQRAVETCKFFTVLFATSCLTQQKWVPHNIFFKNSHSQYLSWFPRLFLKSLHNNNSMYVWLLMIIIRILWAVLQEKVLDFKVKTKQMFWCCYPGSAPEPLWALLSEQSCSSTDVIHFITVISSFPLNLLKEKTTILQESETESKVK